MNNSIYTITTYLHNGAWVFTDPSMGLVREPFVAGADVACARLAGGKPAVTLIFSELPFPGHKLVLEKVKGGPETGTDYTCEGLGLSMWLCPALNRYFPNSPDRLHVDYIPQEAPPNNQPLS